MQKNEESNNNNHSRVSNDDSISAGKPDSLQLSASAGQRTRPAVGGDNVTLVEDDAALIFNNPALLSSVSDKTIGLNIMTYMAGAKTASATFNRTVGKRASWAVSGQYMDYGKMRQTDANNNQLGEFSARDISVAGYFSYMLNDRFAGGITAKFLTSHIGGYNSVGAGIDLGLNYFDPEHDWSLSIVAKNLGGQLKAYDDEYDPPRCLSTYNSEQASDWHTHHCESQPRL